MTKIEYLDEPYELIDRPWLGARDWAAHYTRLARKGLEF